MPLGSENICIIFVAPAFEYTLPSSISHQVNLVGHSNHLHGVAFLCLPFDLDNSGPCFSDSLGTNDAVFETFGAGSGGTARAAQDGLAAASAWDELDVQPD